MRMDKFYHVIKSIRRVDAEKKANDAETFEAVESIKNGDKYFRSWKIWQDIILNDTGEKLGKPYFYYWERFQKD